MKNQYEIDYQQGYDKANDEWLDRIDKIRAEIRALPNANPSYWHSGDMVDRDDVLQILDTYKAETEE